MKLQLLRWEWTHAGWLELSRCYPALAHSERVPEMMLTDELSEVHEVLLPATKDMLMSVGDERLKLEDSLLSIGHEGFQNGEGHSQIPGFRLTEEPIANHAGVVSANVIPQRS